MTFVSVAQATRRLGIDAKTLRRWLADAQLTLQSHPHDGRKKGLSTEELHLLAHRHQRSLAPLPQLLPAPSSGEGPELSARLLALPEQLSALQAQIASLQQQVADLSRLITQPRPEPVIPLARSQRTKPASKPTPPAPRSHPAAKQQSTSAQVLPRVEYGSAGYVVICPKRGLLPLEPDTPAWFAWVAEQDSFRFVGRSGHFTAHHEWRVPKGAWRAHRHIRNHSYTLRLAPTQELTMAVLEQAAEALHAHLT